MNTESGAPSMVDTTSVDHSLYGKGIVFFETNDFRSAISAFKEALVYWPEDSQAWLALGDCYDADKKPRRAINCYRQALKFETPETRDNALYGLGVNLFDQRDFDEAANCFRKISEAADFHELALHNIQSANNWLKTDELQTKQTLKVERLERLN